MEFEQQQPSNLREQLEKLGVDLYEGSISGQMDLGRNLNLNALAIGLGLKNIKYEPETFPGLVYILDEQKMTSVLYENGYIVTIDAPSEAVTRNGLDTVVDRLMELGLIENQSSKQSSPPVTVPAETVLAPTTIHEGGETNESTGEQSETERDVPTSEEVINCPDCDEVLSGDENSCPECGTELTLCPNCGSEIDDNKIFCSECGQKVDF